MEVVDLAMPHPGTLTENPRILFIFNMINVDLRKIQPTEQYYERKVFLILGIKCQKSKTLLFHVISISQGRFLLWKSGEVGLLALHHRWVRWKPVYLYVLTIPILNL